MHFCVLCGAHYVVAGSQGPLDLDPNTPARHWAIAYTGSEVGSLEYFFISYNNLIRSSLLLAIWFCIQEGVQFFQVLGFQDPELELINLNIFDDSSAIFILLEIQIAHNWPESFLT